MKQLRIVLELPKPDTSTPRGGLRAFSDDTTNGRHRRMINSILTTLDWRSEWKAQFVNKVIIGMHHAVAFGCIVNQSSGLHLVRAINLPEEERQQRDDDEVESAREVGELVELENGCDEEEDELDRQDRDA